MQARWAGLSCGIQWLKPVKNMNRDINFAHKEKTDVKVSGVW